MKAIWEGRVRGQQGEHGIMVLESWSHKPAMRRCSPLPGGPAWRRPRPVRHHMSSKAWGSLSRHHSMEAYTAQTYFLMALDTWSSRSRCQQGWGLMRPLLLAWGPCPLHPHSLGANRRAISGISSSPHENTSPIRSGPHPYDLTEP